MTHQQIAIFAINLFRLSSNDNVRLKIEDRCFVFFFFLSPLFYLTPHFFPLWGSMSHSVSAAFKQLCTPLLICPCQQFYISTTKQFHYQSLFLQLPFNMFTLRILALNPSFWQSMSFMFNFKCSVWKGQKTISEFLQKGSAKSLVAGPQLLMSGIEKNLLHAKPRT